jgi:hypothetical protein
MTEWGTKANRGLVAGIWRSKPEETPPAPSVEQRNNVGQCSRLTLPSPDLDIALVLVLG